MSLPGRKSRGEKAKSFFMALLRRKRNDSPIKGLTSGDSGGKLQVINDLERKGFMSDQMISKNTAAALVTGALLGSGVAFFFSPQSGRQTRRKIRHFAENLGYKAQSFQRGWQHRI